MKTNRVLRSLPLITMLFLCVLTAPAQIKTFRGDFFNIVRNVNQTADSVEFIKDTLTLIDVAGSVADFQHGDSIVVLFAQDRFRIVNQFGGNFNDSIRVQVSSPTSISLFRYGYASSPQGSGKILGLKPFFRPVGNIASTSNFNSEPNTIRQMLSVTTLTPSSGMDKISFKRILFKPNVNNLTRLLAPPDTTKDTLRAYHLDGSGNVVNSADIAIVRLLPGMTRMLVWVKDSAQDTDAGEFIGSYGDYSRGRYFLGDTNPESPTSSPFRPTNPHPITGGPNPDYGLRIDGGLIVGALYECLKPMVGGGYYDNPINGLIPPYRVDYHTHLPDDPEFVTSGIDTLRFVDEFGNRTWDISTVPTLKAIVYDAWGSNPVDRTIYLKGYSGANDLLRQKGQIVYRRLHYTHADIQQGQQSAEDYFRVIANATISYLDQGNIPRTLQAAPDSSGGFPRTSLLGGVVVEPPRTGYNGIVPATGTKMIVRPSIPRKIGISVNPPQFQVGSSTELRIYVTDEWGNTVENNERFKLEMSPFSQRGGGRFDSANVVFDSGKVSTSGSQLGQAVRTFRAATGSHNAGYYTVRARSSWSQPERTDPDPGAGFSHAAYIPDGSPNNNFGVIFGPGIPGFGNKLGQTTAIDSVTIFASPVNPVELVAFRAVDMNGKIVLQWQTETEVNNAGFFVERKGNELSDWSQIGFVRGEGTTSTKQSYSFVDEGAPIPSSQKIFYRLRQIDFDGTISYSPIAEFLPSKPNDAFILRDAYPHPVSRSQTDAVRISYALPEQSNISLRLYNVLGNEIMTLDEGVRGVGDHSVQLQSFQFPKGMYIYKLMSSGRMLAAKKLIVID